MEIRKITDENIDEYEDFIDEDIAQSIGREFYRSIAIHDDGEEEPVAAVVWELKDFEEDRDTEAEIEWLYIKDPKAGDMLMEEYENEIMDDEVKRSFFEFESMDKNSSAVIKKSGFTAEKAESRDIVVTVEDLNNLSLVKKKTPPYITSINDLMVRQFRKGITNCLFHSRKGILEDLAFLPMSWYDSDVSCCVQTDEKVNGFLLVHRKASGALVVDLLFALEPDAKINLLNMIRYSINAAYDKFPPETEVILRKHNGMTEALIHKLFPNKKGAEVIKGEKKEEYE